MRRFVSRSPLHCIAASCWLGLSPVAGYASATATKIAELGTLPGLDSASGCALGISGPAAAPASYFFPLAYEELRLSFDAAAGCSTCVSGFRISAIHVVLAIDEPCDLTISANLGSLEATASPECPLPDAVLCQGPQHSVALAGAGLWDIALPVDCDCAAIDEPYTLGIQIHEMSCWPVLMTDGSPTACTNWDNIGWGWVDLPASDSEWPGDLLIFADATCCESVTDAPEISSAPATLRVFPNPTREGATVSFALATPARVDLSVYDVSGRCIATLHRGPLGSGSFQFTWSTASSGASGLPSGTYFVRLVEAERSATRKVVVIR
jgi:hypothetical protein